ncbi:MAG: PKD domain-containing protein, partial [Nitrosopumilus sp.]|nr:PKD domain-containing protein [Nitrosopumilus sp.]
MKRKFRASNKIKIFSAMFVISLLSLSIVSFDSAFAKPDDLPHQARAQIPDNQSNERPQFVSAMGPVKDKDLYVHIWVLVPPGGDRNEIVIKALEKRGVDRNEIVIKALSNNGNQPEFVGEKFSTTGLYWDQFGDVALDNDFVTQNYNPLNDPSGGGGLVALLNTHSTWTNVVSSSFAFDYGGVTTSCGSLVPECTQFLFQTFDGKNDVAWLPLTESNVLGVTWSGTSIDEADMALNTNFSWATNGNDIDIETVLLHENGHVAGLGHSTDGEAVMYPSYHGVLRFLQSDDIDGISSLYPAVIIPTIPIYYDDMESGENGWTTTGDPGLWHQSTNRPNSPTISWYYGDEDNDPPTYNTGGVNSGNLTSPIINLDGATSALLEFYEWSSMENGPDWDRTRVQASSDGSNWNTVFESHETFGSWEKREVNLNSYAGGDVYLRFWFDTIDGQFNDFEGWYVDDVKVLVDNTNTNPNIPPTADAGGPYTGIEGVAIIFDGSGSTDSDGTIVSYDWNFGDGNTGTGVSPSHTYAASGTYSVSLTVTDDDGATDDTDSPTDAIIDPSPNIPPTADAGGPYTGIEGVAIIFDGSGSTDSDGTIVSYDWNF